MAKVAVLALVAGSLMSVTALEATAGTASTAGDPDAVSGSEKVWYLALGDSMSVGFQPNKGETDKGYVDVLARRVREHVPSLDVRKVGCPGETSRALITGERSPCRYRAGSQLDAALAFLAAHAGSVGLVTIDIGANDLLERCMGRRGLIDLECTTEQSPRLQARVEHIVSTLASAAGPDVPIMGMSYYNPFLGFWGNVPGGRALARADQEAWVVFNAGLTSGFEASGAMVANVAETFRIDDFDTTVVLPDDRVVPVNVALACGWTWFCTPPFTTDPHPNTTGYRKVGHTFFDELAEEGCLELTGRAHRSGQPLL